MPCMESVAAPRILDFFWAAESVSEDKSGEDLEIFEEGSLRERLGGEDAEIG